MLRYKRWTFEAWYQSECTNIPSLAPWLAKNHLETLGNESYLVISFHRSILQLTYITQAWMFKFNTCAMQANIWNAHSNASSKFMSLLPLLVCSKILIYPFSFSLLSPYVIYQVYLYVSLPLWYFSPFFTIFTTIFVSLPLCHQWPQRF